jgi:hypothetical protein
MPNGAASFESDSSVTVSAELVPVEALFAVSSGSLLSLGASPETNPTQVRRRVGSAGAGGHRNAGGVVTYSDRRVGSGQPNGGSRRGSTPRIIPLGALVVESDTSVTVSAAPEPYGAVSISSDSTVTINGELNALLFPDTLLSPDTLLNPDGLA